MLKKSSDKIYQGGGVAAPIGAQVLGEVLPYLEVNKDGEKEEDKKEEVVVPNIEGITIKEAQKILKDLGLDIYIENEEIDKEKTIIKEQTPKSGIKVYKGTNIAITI